jgi:poly(3-hydroxyalkanoate) depolymerase
VHTPHGARPGEVELVRLGGRTIRAARWRAHPKSGQKPKRPLLFFNGIGANIELMTPLADWFPERDILTFDMPGVGHSPSPVLPYRPWMMARFTAKLLEKYHYDVVDVMGVSWGGGMAQQFAFQHPRRVGKVVLAATSAGMVMVPGDVASLSKMAHPRRYMDPDYLKRNFQELYGGETDGSGDHVERIKSPSRIGYLYQLAAMAGWTSAYWLPFLRQKTLILMGDKDRIVPLINGRILHTLIPRARLEVVPGGGHLFLVSRARDVAPVISTFLDEPDAPASLRAKAA